MSLTNIVAGDYGQVIKITFIDVDTNLAADISGYSSSKSMVFTSPAGVETTKTAAFDTDGTDGVISYTADSGFLTAGNWNVRGRVASASAVLSTEKHRFLVSD